MMGLFKWTKALGCCVLYFFFVLLIQAKSILSQQEGFVSIQCCAPSEFIDPNTKIEWISDNDIQHNGECRNISNNPEINDSGYKLGRLFGTGPGKKWCYNLTTVSGLDYLLRSTFIHGNNLQTSPDTFFDISINTTTISRVNSLANLVEVESVFSATNGYIDFCIVPRSGNPYLSKLELRPLNDLDYLNNDPSSILKVVQRVDLGNTEELIRYPYDLNDRIWNINASQIEDATISNANIGVTGANTTLPLQVLQTAVTNTKQLEFLHDDLSEDNKDYFIYLYFLELNTSAGVGQRVFDIYVNGLREPESFDILGNNSTSNYREIKLHVTSKGVLNVSLIKADDAELGPICNAYEILEVQKLVNGTLKRNVNAIVKFRDELLLENQENKVLEGWSGDPCLPLPWEGLLCDPLHNGSLAITNLDLSSSGLQGPLPPIITGLTHLKQLNLSFNKFTGTIPAFMRFSLLMLMDVSHNDLTGPFPESLVSLVHLSRLDFGCNPRFGNDVPSQLSSRPNFTTDFGICATPEVSSSRQHVFIGTTVGGSILFVVAIGAILIFVYRRRRRLSGKDQRMTKRLGLGQHSNEVRLK